MPATVSGNLKTLGTAVPGGNPTVRFWLYNTGGNIPRVIGTGVIVPNYVDFTADASGAISGSIYKNSEIDVGGATNTYYHVEFINLTGVVPSANYTVTGSTFDITTATPITTTPTVTSPTGDNTYVQLTGGNMSSAALGLYDAILPVKRADKQSGSDIGVQVNAAIAALGSAGGTIIIPPGSYSFSTQINADDTKSINIIGAGNPTGGASAATQLIYTGTSTPISAKSTAGFKFSGIQLLWSNAAFAGTVINFAHSGTGGDSSNAEVDHCYFGKSGSGGNAAVILSFDKCINSGAHDNSFQNYTVGIQCAASSASYSNSITIGPRNIFSSSTGTAVTAHIQNPTQACMVFGNTFEMGSGAGTPCIIKTTSSVVVAGLQFVANWVGDAAGASTYIYFDFNASGSGNIAGLFFAGNYLPGTATSTCVKLPNTCQAVFLGNAVGPFANLFDLQGASCAVDIGTGNSFIASVPTFFATNNPVRGYSMTAGSTPVLNGGLFFQGNGAVPSSLSGMTIAGGAGGGQNGRVYIGDGSSNTVDFLKRVAGVDTVVSQMKDNGDITATRQLISSVATGTAPLSITSTTSVSNLTCSSHPQPFNSANTLQTGTKIYSGTGTLSSATPSTATITLTGGFSGSGSYVVAVTNTTTQANSLKVANTSGTQFTVTGPNTVTDGFNWIAVGT